MKQTTIHNPDRYMSDLRQILSQGKKRIGLLVGAGGPMSVRVDANGVMDDDGEPLIPDVARLTQCVLDELEPEYKKIANILVSELGEDSNIESLLTRIRMLSQAIGGAKVHGFDSSRYENFAEIICDQIGKIVATPLPSEPNPFIELISWIGGTHRSHPIEIFTPNYDLLFEEAFERARLPFFDGFAGAHKPFFDPSSISDDALPARWSRLWKIHGSLGWDINEDVIIRTGSRKSTKLIFPEHLKYDQITRQPYSALFERLKEFLTTPDSLLLCAGFSFSDAHIAAVLDEALASNTHTAVIAFQYRTLDRECSATKLALTRPNLSVYASDGAVIHGVKGEWKLGEPQNHEWVSIRQTFWKTGEMDSGKFQLGDFAKFARFLALTQAEQFGLILGNVVESGEDGKPKTVVESSTVLEDGSEDGHAQS